MLNEVRRSLGQTLMGQLQWLVEGRRDKGYRPGTVPCLRPQRSVDGKRLAGDKGELSEAQTRGKSLALRHALWELSLIVVSSLTWAQQEATGTCLITSHGGDNNLVTFLNGGLVSDPHGRQNHSSIQVPLGSAWLRLAVLAAQMLSVWIWCDELFK